MPSVNEPRVSVIIPVRDRRALLRRALDALSAQSLAEHEVIVVDDASTDGSGEEAERDAAAGRPVRLVRTSGGSSGAARDRGVAEARAPYLAFTDSDCVPEPDWLERGVAALDEGADLVQGYTDPLRPVAPLERSIWVTREDGLYATCNLFLRRSAYDRAGGFVESAAALPFRSGSGGLAIAFGADSLLGWRVRRSGSAVFHSEVVVKHHVFPPDVRDTVTRAWMAHGFPPLVREAPELRTTLLRRRVLLGDGRRLWLYGAAALLASEHRLSAAAALSVWTAMHARRVHRHAPNRRELARVLAVELARDAVTATALVVGSVRAKTIVL